MVSLPHARFFSLVLCFLAGFQVSAESQTIWLAPVDDLKTPQGFQVDEDYRRLFEEPVTWPQALSHTKVFMMSRRFVQMQTDAALRPLFEFLNRHSIAFAMGVGITPAVGCSQNVEGTAHSPVENLQVAQKLQRLGANLGFVSVDESFYYGHHFRGKNACQYSIPDLANGYERNIRQIKSIFPHVQVVESEPVDGLSQATDAANQLDEWITALQSRLGDDGPKAFILDVQWARNWRQEVPPILSVLKRHNMPYGLYLNGSYADTTDQQWIASAKAHIREWRETITEKPSHLIIGSWNEHPSTVLPESSPTTLTYLINWWVCTRLQAGSDCH